MTFLFIILPCWLHGQVSDPVLDSMKARVDQELSAEVAAEYYRDIMWYIFRTEEAGYEDFPERFCPNITTCLESVSMLSERQDQKQEA